MAPDVADWFDTQRASGRLTLSAGRIGQVARGEHGVQVTWRPRGQASEQTSTVARIINCTGPGAARARAADPLVYSLIDGGAARIDPLGLGLDVDGDCQVLDAQGQADGRLFAVGPLTRGAFWEVVAVPDIRNQVADLAGRLSRKLAARW